LNLQLFWLGWAGKMTFDKIHQGWHGGARLGLVGSGEFWHGMAG